MTELAKGTPIKWRGLFGVVLEDKEKFVLVRVFVDRDYTEDEKAKREDLEILK